MSFYSWLFDIWLFFFRKILDFFLILSVIKFDDDVPLWGPVMKPVYWEFWRAFQFENSCFFFSGIKKKNSLKFYSPELSLFSVSKTPIIWVLDL